MIELKYREKRTNPLITYHLAIEEKEKGPVVVEEWLQWRRQEYGRPFKFLEYRSGQGSAVSGELPDESDKRIETPLRSPDLIAVIRSGNSQNIPELRHFENLLQIGMFPTCLWTTRGANLKRALRKNISKSGGNLPNVVQYLKESHPFQLALIFQALSKRIPRIESVLAESMPDGRLLLQIKDAPFERPILSRFASDGTLKMFLRIWWCYMT